MCLVTSYDIKRAMHSLALIKLIDFSWWLTLVNMYHILSVSYSLQLSWSWNWQFEKKQ